MTSATQTPKYLTKMYSDQTFNEKKIFLLHRLRIGDSKNKNDIAEETKQVINNYKNKLLLSQTKRGDDLFLLFASIESKNIYWSEHLLSKYWSYCFFLKRNSLPIPMNPQKNENHHTASLMYTLSSSSAETSELFNGFHDNLEWGREEFTKIKQIISKGFTYSTIILIDVFGLLTKIK